MRLLRTLCIALAFATPLAAPSVAHAQAAKALAIPSAKPAAMAAATTGLIDINSAGPDVLKGIPGIGDASAAKIKDRIIAKQ